MRWSLAGSWPMLVIAGILSSLAGVTEVVSALILGWVIDAAVSSGPTDFFAAHWSLVVWFLFLPDPPPPRLRRLLGQYQHHHRPERDAAGPIPPAPLDPGQAVTFFDNDFAGRIAQKQMQAARAVTDVATEVINTVCFALASGLIGSVAFLIAVDWKAAIALAVWLVAYIFLIRFFMPMIRVNSAARASSRAMVSGQVVDTITNIKTVKLFAHAAFEDRVAIDAMEVFRDRSLEFGVISTWFPFALMLLAGVLPVLLIGGTVLLWQPGRYRWDIAAAGAIALRIAQMSGWVSFTLMSIYTSVGEVEDGMRTLSVPHTLADATDAATLPRIEGEILFDHVTFAYGRERGGVSDIDLTIHAGEKLGIVGASGAGKSSLVLPPPPPLRPRTGPHHGGRLRPPLRHTGKPAQADRHGHAGNRDVQSQRPRQYRLRRARTSQGRDHRPRRGRRGGRVHRQHARPPRAQGLRRASLANAA